MAMTGYYACDVFICTVVTVMGKQCLTQAVLEPGSLEHSVLQTPALDFVYIRSKKAHSSLQDKYLVFIVINVRLIKSISLSFIGWWDNVVHSVQKSYVDNLEALKFLHLNLLSTSLEFLND